MNERAGFGTNMTAGGVNAGFKSGMESALPEGAWMLPWMDGWRGRDQAMGHDARCLQHRGAGGHA